MSGKFVRASKYRHVFGQVAKKERQYENVRVTNNAWDSNLIKVNTKFIALNWNSSGGGAFAVIPLNEVGKAPDQVPLFRGHTAHVLDTDFNPFDDYSIASASDDGKIGIWEIPKDYSFHDYTNGDGEPKDLKPKKFLSGHGRKVGHVLFHPTTENILASSSLDHTVKIWDIESGKEVFSLKHPDMVTSMSFSFNGDHLVTVARDKRLRVWDVRAEKIVSEGPAHSGAKNQRVVWLGNSDRIVTTGFSKLSDRQIGVWDAFNLEKGDLGGFYTVDQSSGIMMPFYDGSNKILYLVGKGDGNIRYFEFQNDELFELSEFQSVDPQRGFAAAPRRAVNVKENEILKGYKTVNDHCIEPISFCVPRKSDSFQDDIYPDAPSGVAALSAEEWISGKSVTGPLLFNVKSLYDGSDAILTPSAAVSERPAPSSSGTSDSRGSDNESAITSEGGTHVKDPVTKSAKSPSQPVGDINVTLKDNKSIDKLLKKSTDLDELNNAEDPSKDISSWDEEDDDVDFRSCDPKSSVSKQTKESANDIPSKSEGTKEDKTIDQKKTPVEPASAAKVQNDEEVKSVPPNTKSTDVKGKEQGPGSQSSSSKESDESNKKTASTSLQSEASIGDATATTNNSTAQLPTKVEQASPALKSMGLKQCVEKLSDLVIKLDQTVTHLTQANLEKDERLKALEAKIDQLLTK